MLLDQAQRVGWTIFRTGQEVDEQGISQSIYLAHRSNLDNQLQPRAGCEVVVLTISMADGFEISTQIGSMIKQGGLVFIPTSTELVLKTGMEAKLINDVAASINTTPDLFRIREGTKVRVLSEDLVPLQLEKID